MVDYFLLLTTRIIHKYLQFFQFLQQPDLIHFTHTPFNRRMPKVGSKVCLEVAELFQESADLYDNPKDAFFCRMVMHREPFDGFVILDYWVESFLFQLLPISRKVVLVGRIEQQEEVLDVRYLLFQFEVAFAHIQMVCFLL